MFKRAPAFLCLLALCLLTSCALHHPPEKPLEDVALSTTVTHLKATATVHMVRRGQLDLRGRALLIAQKPDLFRIEVLGPFNQTALVMTSDGTYLSLLDMKQRELHRWSDRQGPYPLTGREIVQLLFGHIPDHPADGSGWKAEIFPVDEKVERRSFLRETPDGGTVRVEMDYLRPVSDMSLPLSISLASPLGELAIHYREVTVNADTENTDFALVTPPGVEEWRDR